MMSLSSEGQHLSENLILSTHLNPRLRYNYFRFGKTTVRHIEILLPVSILTTWPSSACNSALGCRISFKSVHPQRRYNVISIFKIAAAAAQLQFLFHHRLCGSASTVKGDRPSQWEMAKFNPSQNRHPWADCNKIMHNWLRPRGDPLNQIWYKSIHWGLLGILVKYNVFVPFLLIYLFIPFFLRLAYRSDRLMDFYAR